jgi:hypothetical protein
MWVVLVVVAYRIRELGELSEGGKVAIKGTNELTIVNGSQLSRARFHAPSLERSLRRKVRRLSGLLIALSLVPGFAMVVSPDKWRLLAPGVQWSAYLFSIILLVAAWSLLQGRHNSEAKPDQEGMNGDEPSSTR